MQTTTTIPTAETAETGVRIEQPLPIGRVLRLSSFHIGSAMGDILLGSVWNRVMIANLGLPAWPVGLLLALRYLLSPLSLWAGHRSDRRPLFGLRRTPYIWAGRGLMLVSLPLLGVSLARLSQARADALGWLLAVVAFLLFGSGTLISGSPFLALVRDSVPPARQGIALSLVETALITFFPLAAVGFGYWLETYSLARFWGLVVATVVLGGFFWLFAIAGAERRAAEAPAAAAPAGFRATFGRILADGRTRRFLIFLVVGMLGAWAQESILEPAGMELFGLDVGQTTRFAAYWQGPTVIALVASLYLRRRSRPEQQVQLSKIGLGGMAAGMGLLALAAGAAELRLLWAGLVVFGAGFGLYTFGAFSLLVTMSTDREAGAYLALWSVVILLSRGLGIALGGALRDLFLALSGAFGSSYAAVFGLEAAGLLAAAALLSRADIRSFAHEHGRLAGGRD
ncbi:MAG: BCD family MFS transporter [Candidatus Promineifilaceae bacterium]